MAKKKKHQKEYIEYLDEMGDASLADGDTKSDWLDWLMGLRDEIEMRIDVVRDEVKREEGAE